MMALAMLPPPMKAMDGAVAADAGEAESDMVCGPWQKFAAIVAAAGGACS
jgi:hypothetical protein